MVMRQRSTMRQAVAGAGHMIGPERRRSRRAAIYLAGHLAGPARRWAVDVLELSLHGARVCGRGSFEVGQVLVLALVTPTGALSLVSQVIWIGRSRRRTAGLAFGPLTGAELEILEAAMFILEGERRPSPEMP